MLPVKQKIIKNAEKLFFEHGIANVRLQQIADKSGISVGHLAYHYKNKEAIVSAAYKQVFDYMSGILNSPMQFSDLTDFEKLFRAVYHLGVAYPFCFNNKWEIARNHPLIGKKWESFLNKKLLLTQKLIGFHAAKGNLKPEPYKEAYKLLAQQMQLVFHFWMPYRLLRAKPVTFKYLEAHLWGLLFPYLSSKGTRAYNQLIAEKKSPASKTVQKIN